MKESRTIFITGIAGFIGFHLAQHLVQQGYSVLGCDNFNDYYSPLFKQKRAEILDRMGIQVLQIDILDILSIQNELKRQRISSIVHLAAQAGVRYADIDPLSYGGSNLQGFLTMLELTRILHVPFFFASSSSVYTQTRDIPSKETNILDSPRNLYAATKQSGELLAKSYHHLYQIPMVGFRFFTVYGPWGRPDMAYFSFAKKILSGQSLPLFNGGDMSRDFTYIDDIVRGITASLSHSSGFELYNLGRGRAEPLMALVKELESGLNKKAHWENLPKQPGEALSSLADISKAKKNLGFQPKIDLKEGIAHFLKWFTEEYLKTLSS